MTRSTERKINIDAMINFFGTKIKVRKIKPTRRHRLAIVPGILGTVYGVNERGEARYFDYKIDDAYRFAGLSVDSDLRLSVPPGRYQYVRSGAREANPGPRTRCIWVLVEK